MFFRIVFGTYSFRIKSFDPKQFGIVDEEIGNNPIEVRQKCFHLFYIPCLGVGKVYVFRKGDELFTLSEEIIQRIKAKKRVRTPFYTFSAFILAFLILFIDFATYEWNRSSSHSYYSDKHEQQMERNLRIIGELDTTHYIKLLSAQYPETDNGLYAKVHSVEKNFIVIQELRTGLSAYREQKVSHLIKDYYLKNKDHLRTDTITLNDLKNAICMSYDSVFNRQAKGSDLFNNGKFYVIEYIERIDDGPTLRVDYPSVYQSNIDLHISNFGGECQLVKIENIVGDIKWETQLPKKLKTDDLSYTGGITGFSIDGTNYQNEDYSIILHLKTDDGTKYRYSVIGDFEDFVVERLK